MGCDIHFEIEIEKNGQWDKTPTDLEGWRDYRAFGILAGVRDGWVEPISEPRGHVDIGLETRRKDGWGVTEIRHKYGWEDMYYHSHSWLNLAELKAYDWNDGVKEDGVKDTWVYQKLIPEMESIAKREGLTNEEIRVVFCFDS